MGYNWAQLAFVEKWRQSSVRGQLVGMYRPDNRTFFDLRLHPREGGVGKLPGAVELHLLDAGDLIREKRLVLTTTVPVIVRIVASSVTPTTGPTSAAPSTTDRSRRWLESGSRMVGRLLQREEDTAVLDLGLPVVVQLPEDGAVSSLQPGQSVEFTVSEIPKGFIVF